MFLVVLGGSFGLFVVLCGFGVSCGLLVVFDGSW